MNVGCDDDEEWMSRRRGEGRRGEGNSYLPIFLV